MAAAWSRLGVRARTPARRHRFDLFSPHLTWEPSREQAHVPAEQPASPQDARFPSPDAHPCRSGNPGLSSAQGPQSAGCLSPGRLRECRSLPVDDPVLPQPLRLRRRPEFRLAVRAGRRSGRRTLVAHVWQPAESRSGTGSTFHPAESSPVVTSGWVPARVGFVVGRGVGSAVTRNRVKRRLRHLMRPRMNRLTGGSLCVIRALPPAASASYGELERDLDAALLNAGGDGS
jgi:ribonuclease P protein component